MPQVPHRCYETHKPLEIEVGLKRYYVYGGSCLNPVVTNADIYVGLDFSMNLDRYMPWKVSEVIALKYVIVDYAAPHDADDFVQLIAWLAHNIIAGRVVHIGCIGGHGRTGLVLAALYSYMTADCNAIQYVRTNYCLKAVESTVQIKFLQKYFNCKKVSPAKPRGLDFPKRKKAKKQSHSVIMPSRISLDNIWTTLVDRRG